MQPATWFDANPLMVIMLALGLGLLFLGIAQLVNDLRRVEKRRVEQRLAGGPRTDRPVHLLRQLEPTDRSLIARMLNSEALGRSLQEFILQADVPWPAHRFVGVILLLMSLTAMGCLLVNSSYPGRIPAWGIGLLVIAIGLTPIIVLMVRRHMRLKKYVEQLPEVFELLCQALRAGHSLVTGVQLVGQQLSDPVGKEFARVFQEQNFGVKLEDALNNLADRSGLLEVHMFVAAVLIQRQTGGDLGEVLDRSGEVIRDRLKVAGAVRALTAEGRMSGWVLTGLPIVVGLLVWRLNPTYMNELIYGDAKWLLKFAIVLHLGGILLIRKIIQVQY